MHDHCRGVRAFHRTAQLRVDTAGAALLLLAVCGCGEEPKSSPTLQCPPADLGTRDAAALFESESLPRFEIGLPQGVSWGQLMREAREEKYTSVRACYNGEAIGEIGLRFKGQVGSLERCFENDELVCKKLSLRLKFDFTNDQLRFYGLKHLNLHSLRGDPSHVRERLAYDLYRAFDVDAPRSSWAELVVNGQAQGLYSMVEQIDGRFAASRWPDADDGDLYKEAWPTTTDPEYYRERLETHEETASPDALVALGSRINAASAEDGLAVLAEFMDPAQLFRYMVVDDAIANWDGITTFYLDEGGRARNHNFFIYAAPSSASGPALRLVPWDMDHTFEVPNWRSPAPYWREPLLGCPLLSLGCLAAPCDPLLRALASDANGYSSAARALLAGPFAEGRLEAQLAEHVTRLRGAVERDSLGPNIAEWEMDVGRVREALPLLREYVRRRSDGPELKRLTVAAQGALDMSQYDDMEIQFGLYALAASGSQASAKRTSLDSPLPNGLRFDFTLDASAENWAIYVLPLSTPNLDVRGRTGVRFRARGEGAGYAGLNVDSAEGDVGTRRWSWPLLVSADVRDYELRFDELVWNDATVQGPSRDLVLEHAQDFMFVLTSNGEEPSGFLEIRDFEVF